MAQTQAIHAISPNASTDQSRELAGSLLAQQGFTGTQVQQFRQQLDVARLSQEGSDEPGAGQGASSGKVGAIKSMVQKYAAGHVPGTAAASRSMQNWPRLGNGVGAQGGGGGSGSGQTAVHVNFEPVAKANTILAPDSAIGNFHITTDPPTGDASNQDSQGEQGSQAAAGSGPSSRPRVDAASEANLRQLQSRGQTSGVGSVVGPDGSAVDIPSSGGTLRTRNWEQSVFVHPGGELQGSGLLHSFRKLDNAPSQIYMSAGKSAPDAAADLRQEQKRHPQQAGSLNAEVQKLLNPVPGDST